ncbi:MAG: Major facilitator superfamily 1 transporter [Myxococcales bacterium]|nr:Major facilitator superfamily 1 transporter [Myxococcales bacterium]
MLGFLTVAAAFAVANLYYAQPLAAQIAQALDTTASGVSPALVGTQLGYAAGMLLLVPLGDVRERRGVLVVTALGAALSLVAFALAPSIVLLTTASLLVGLGASITQMILPFAVGLAPSEERGRVVGTVMGGVLAGILLSRTVSGALGAVLGWRAVFLIAAGLMAMLGLAFRTMLPVSPPASTLSYRALLGSLLPILRREPVLRRRALVGALGFASFSVFWSTIVFHLAASPIGGGSGLAGMLGIIGLTGIVVAPIVGRLAMRVRPTMINVLGLVLVILGFGVFAALPDSLIAICVGVVLLDAGVQASHLTNQTVVFGLAPTERNRVNAIYMVGYFLGGALGTAAGAQAWQLGGWPAVCAVGAACALAAIVPLRR